MVNKDVLKEVLKQNRELVENMKVVKRDFPFYDHFRYVLVGVRRAGKSFLLFQRMQELLREGGIKWQLKQMQQQGLTRRVGPDKGGYWVLNIIAM